MKNIIEAIIESDARAKKIVDAAQDRSRQIERSIPAELEKIRRDAYEVAERSLDLSRGVSNERTVAELEKIKVFREQKLGEFRELYLREGDGWVNDIYAAVVSDGN